jgi:hypothetical protein
MHGNVEGAGMSSTPLEVGDIDLTDEGFWAQPWQRKLDALALLRRDAPFASFAEPEIFPAQPRAATTTRSPDTPTSSR